MDEHGKKHELIKLLNVPAVVHYFLSQLDEVKATFKTEIESYQKLLGEEIKETGSLEKELFEKDHSYQFELYLEGGAAPGAFPKWQLKKFKYGTNKEIVRRLFEDFEKRLIDHKTAAGVIKHEYIILKSADTLTFEISFMRSRDDRVVGYVKRIENINTSGKTSSMIKIPTNYQDYAVLEPAMHRELSEWMKEDPEVRDEILFYFLMLKNQRSNA